MNFTDIFRVKPLWKDPQLKTYFSLAIYAEKLKNHKIPFFGYKKWSKFKSNITFENFGG